jgi:hypothetical protein
MDKRQRDDDSAAPDEESSRGPVSWLRVDPWALGISFVLAVLAGIYAYSGSPLAAPEYVFLLVVFYALARTVRWAWVRFKNSRGK